MRDPAGEEESRSRAGQVGRQELLGASGHVIANVIDRHQHYDGAAQSIYRLKARRWCRLDRNRGSGHDSAILFLLSLAAPRGTQPPPGRTLVGKTGNSKIVRSADDTSPYHSLRRVGAGL